MGYRLRPFTMSVRDNSTQQFVDVGLLGSDVDGEIAALQDDVEDLQDLNLEAKTDWFVTPEMYGAVGDGVTDDKTAIQSAVNSGRRVVFSEGKTYLITPDADTRIHAGIILPSNAYLDLNNATLKIAPNDYVGYAILSIESASNIVIRNGIIIGDRNGHTGTSGEWGHGISLEGGSHVFIENVQIYDCWGDGINIGGLGPLSEYVYINSVFVSNSRRNAICVERVTDLIVENSTFINSHGTNPQSGIAIETNNSNDTVTRTKFVHCTTYGHSGETAAYATLHSSGTVYFDNCVIENSSNYGIGFRCMGNDATVSDRFIINNCDISAPTPILCTNINAYSEVNANNVIMRNVSVTPIRLVNGNDPIYNVKVKGTVINSTCSDGAYVSIATQVRKCTFDLLFDNCDVTDPRVLGSGYFDDDTCLIILKQTTPKVYDDSSGIYNQLGGSNTDFVVSSEVTTNRNLFNFGPFPKGTRYTVVNKSAKTQYLRNVPNSGVKIENWTPSTTVDIGPGATLVLERISSGMVVGTYYS